jgi:hypothetical protein
LVEIVALRSMKAMTPVAVHVPQFVEIAAARVTIAVADVISGPHTVVTVAGISEYEGCVLAAEAVDQSDVLRALAVAVHVPHTVVMTAGMNGGADVADA